jgi:DhnA family fructose-bisphosphate aldolase class Ia
LPSLLLDPPDALLAFIGLFRAHNHLLNNVPIIVNLTASTVLSRHTQKVLVTTIEQAIQVGADAVAVHVNLTSQFEAEMLRTLGSAVHECESYGMPLLAIMYPRGESASGDNNYESLKKKEQTKYAALVAHSARIAADLGADIIKTKYTDSPDSFRVVVEACEPTPILVAGGPALPMDKMLRNAHGAICAGAAGVSFGRNIFTRNEPQPFITALKAVVHGGLTPDQAIKSASQRKRST